MVAVVKDISDDDGLAYDPDETSPLAALAHDLEQDVAAPTRLRHPTLSDYVLIFRSHVETAEAQNCQKRAKNAKDPVRVQNAMLLAITNTGIEKDGTVVENSRGAPVTFRDPELLTALKAKTAADCVVAFLGGNDGHLIALADAVMRAAGFGTEVEIATDPM